jgi:hypothetical protein
MVAAVAHALTPTPLPSVTGEGLLRAFVHCMAWVVGSARQDLPLSVGVQREGL